ncbi:hypothetical protein Trydic_g6229 [Trypoxylus dichotomus]
MMKFAVVSALLVFSSRQVQSGTILGGLGGLSGGGHDGFSGFSLPAPAPLPAALPAPSIPDFGGAGPDPSLYQGGDGGDFHGGTSIIGGGGGQQGQTLDLTGHVADHSGKVFGGSFISASVSGKSGSYGSSEGADGGAELDIHSLAGLSDGLGAYAGVSSYDVGHGGDSGEVTGVLGGSYDGGDLGAGGHFGGYH